MNAESGVFGARAQPEGPTNSAATPPSLNAALIPLFLPGSSPILILARLFALMSPSRALPISLRYNQIRPQGVASLAVPLAGLTLLESLNLGEVAQWGVMCG